MDPIHSYRARWVVPVAGPPVEHGIVVVQGERVVGIHRMKRPDTIDLGDVAIVPGLVNCHTHLEFSNLMKPLQPMSPFTDWIRQVVAWRREQSGNVATAIQNGLQESLRSGVTLVGDIATSGWTKADYRTGPDTVVFQELLGLTAERIAQQKTLADSHLEKLHDGNLTLGLSPHAPYSVHPEMFRHIVSVAQPANVPVAMHLAETEAERQLLFDGTGEFRSLLEDFGIWQPEIFGGRTWCEFLEPLSELSHALVIHGNYLSNDDLLLLAQNPHMTLVYCPRTHAAFGHAPHPWLTLLNLGASVALGTDSRASNPDLSLWSELQFLAAKHPGVSHLELLQMATLTGARALGQARDHGSLEAGKFANLAVIGPMPEDGPALHRELITQESQIRKVMFHGQWVEP